MASRNLPGVRLERPDETFIFALCVGNEGKQSPYERFNGSLQPLITKLVCRTCQGFRNLLCKSWIGSNMFLCITLKHITYAHWHELQHLFLLCIFHLLLNIHYLYIHQTQVQHLDCIQPHTMALVNGVYRGMLQN